MSESNEVESIGMLVSFGDVPLGHRIKYPEWGGVYTVIKQYREEGKNKMSGVVAEYRKGIATRASLCSHIAETEDCPDMVILLD